ncbi:hypothetical protein INT45_010565 [Circinella minor]|uniref:Uncharacterized protein n=1 Tax=Circinella minor TaxID=1195481 RepID=A0A8H7VRM3_9FUNG|nr:hypothetical protein INT45_010565 [Circinella minor]
MSSETYYNLWRQRFLQEFRDLRPELPLKPPQYQKDIWTQKYLELAQLRATSQATRVETLRSLEYAMPLAGSNVYSTLNSIAAEIEPQVHNFKGTSEINENDRLMQSFLHYSKCRGGGFFRAVILKPGVHGFNFTAQVTTTAASTSLNERQFIVEMSKKNDSISSRLLGEAAKNLLIEEGWDNEMDITTKYGLEKKLVQKYENSSNPSCELEGLENQVAVTSSEPEEEQEEQGEEAQKFNLIDNQLLSLSNIFDTTRGYFCLHEAIADWILKTYNYILKVTFIHQCATPFVDSVFARHGLSIRIGELHVTRRPHSMTADYVAAHKTTTWSSHDILAIEIKPPGIPSQSQLKSDFVKIGKECKDMIDDLLELGVENPYVPGVLIEGKKNDNLYHADSSRRCIHST